MVKELNNKEPEHDPLTKLQKWTIEDYYFYMDFLNELFAGDTNVPLSEKEKAYIDEAYKRFMKRISPDTRMGKK